MKTLRCYLARASLCLIALAAIFGIYAVRVYMRSRVWPVTTHHPHLLVLIGVVIAWAIVIVLAFCVVFLILRALVRAADSC